MNTLMAEPIKIKVDFDGEANALLHFITETQEGKYTEIKPDLNQITYKRLKIQEQDNCDLFDIDNEENLLLGVL
jgi:hypothetical protein